MNIVTDEKKILHPYVPRNGVLMAQSHLESFPAGVNEVEGYRRIAPKSALQTGSQIQNGSLVDILIQGDHGGFAHSLIVEVKLKEIGNLASATVSTQLLFERVEIYVEGSKKLFKTLYPDEFGVLDFLTISYEELRKNRKSLGINMDYTPEIGNLPQNSTKSFFLKIPIFKGSQVDFRNISGGVTFRFIFNSASVFCDNASSTDVSLSDINIILRQLNIEHFRPPKTLRHKYLNYIRNSQQISNMGPNNEYDIKLNSIRGYCSHLVILVRQNPHTTNYINHNTFIGNIDEVTFADASNKRVAIPFTKDFNNHVMSETLNSDFIVSYPTGNNVWLLSFNMTLSGAQHGIFFGNYLLTTNEHVYLKTSPAFVAGSYVIDIWAGQMGFFDVNSSGQFEFSS